MSKRDGRQRGAQRHSEGEHGEKTHEAIIDALEGKNSEPELADGPRHTGDTGVFGQPLTGKHRLREDREQHDIAEKNSEAVAEERLEEED